MREIEFGTKPLCKGITALGNAYAFVYFLESEGERALIDTGTAFWGLQISSFFRSKGIESFNYTMFTHSHYDHIGGMPILQRSIEVETRVAHPGFERVFSSKRALSLIENLNRKELELLGVDYDYRFEPFPIDEKAEEEKVVQLGDIQVQILETPGHTRDSVSYYVPKCGLAVVGEAVGVPNADYSYILPQFLADVELYLSSFDKIASLDIEILGLPHERIIEGRDEVKAYLQRSRQYTLEFIEDIRRALEKFDTLDEVIEYMVKKYYEGRKIRQPIYAFRENLKAQIRAVKRLMMSD